MRESLDDILPDSAALDAERHRLDFAILGFNRHAILAEEHRLLIERYKGARDAFQASLASHAAILAELRRGAGEREKWHIARAEAAVHRDSIRASVRTVVHLLRDSGLAPERVLVLVKHRLVHNVSVEAPGAPVFDARALETDVSAWTIDAYFDAA